MAVVLFCGNCGSGYVPEADRILAGYYQDEYAQRNRRDRSDSPKSYFASADYPPFKRYFDRARAQVAMLKDAGAVFGDVLDYGSGPGYFLHEARPQRAFAVELDENSHKYLDHLNATRLDASDLGSDRFDVIVASHVVEHFTATTLDRELSRIAAALKVGGRLLIEVPHGGHTYLRINGEQEPHTFFFTPQGLLAAMQRAGLEVLVARARGSQDKHIRDNAVYLPPADDSFDGPQRDLPVVIATRSV